MIRLLLEEQSDHGLHCLSFYLLHLHIILQRKLKLFNFRIFSYLFQVFQFLEVSTSKMVVEAFECRKWFLWAVTVRIMFLLDQAGSLIIRWNLVLYARLLLALHVRTRNWKPVIHRTEFFSALGASRTMTVIRAIGKKQHKRCFLVFILILYARFDCRFYYILSHNLGRSSGHHRWISNNPFPSCPVFSCPSWPGKVPIPLHSWYCLSSSSSVCHFFSFSFHCALYDCLLVGWLGFNGPLRQYFSLYRAVSHREGERKEKW